MAHPNHKPGPAEFDCLRRWLDLGLGFFRLQHGDIGRWVGMTLTRENKGSTARRPKNSRKCGANVVRGSSRLATSGRFPPLALLQPGLFLERTTGFEPATLTLAR